MANWNVELPCQIGDTVYFVGNNYMGNKLINEVKVAQIKISDIGIYIVDNEGTTYSAERLYFSSDLINRQQEEIDKLTYDLESAKIGINDIKDYLGGIIDSQKAEIARLNKEVDRLSQVVLYNDGVTEMKVDEAIKEFAETLKFMAKKDGAYDYVSWHQIDSVEKELTGEDEGK